MAVETHLNDIGTIIRVTLKDNGVILDISPGTTLELIFRKPDNDEVTKIAVFTTNGTDGKMEYVTIANDLDVVGIWNVQAHIIFPTGDWRSDIGSFLVSPNV